MISGNLTQTVLLDRCRGISGPVLREGFVPVATAPDESVAKSEPHAGSSLPRSSNLLERLGSVAEGSSSPMLASLVALTEYHAGSIKTLIKASPYRFGAPVYLLLVPVEKDPSLTVNR